jgi:hypothetical protein
MIRSTFSILVCAISLHAQSSVQSIVAVANSTAAASRQWSRSIPPGPRPTGRYGHTLNILGSRLYVFGGQVEGYFFNDLVAFDLNQLQNPNNKWELLIKNSHEGGPQPGQIPPARTNHTIVSFNDKLYL